MVMPVADSSSNRRRLETMVLMVILEGETPRRPDDTATKAGEGSG